MIFQSVTEHQTDRSDLSVTSVTRLGDLLDFGQLLKPLVTINLPKSPTFLGNFVNESKAFF